jgi:hypothetical protein
MAGMAPIEVPGCEVGCEHEWHTERVYTENAAGKRSKEAFSEAGPDNAQQIKDARWREHQWCHLCGGWRGCLGLEPTVEMFVGHIVLIWRALWRVMRDDAVCFLNLGDSYCANKTGSASINSSTLQTTSGDKKRFASLGRPDKTAVGLKPKDLIGIPWRVAFALQADGWYLRSDLIWAKGLSFCAEYSGSCMPESVRDRPTKGHEYVFLLSKQARYFYDGDAVREAGCTPGGITWDERKEAGEGARRGYNRNRPAEAGGTMATPSSGRNLRTVWAINPGSYAGAHFATFSPKLVEPMIKSGTSQRGCCPSCGAQWERVTEKERTPTRPGDGRIHWDKSRNDGGIPLRPELHITTTGFRPTCTHYDDLYRHDFPQARSARKRWQRQRSGNWWKRTRKRAGLDHWPVEPCTVLDPFLGSGTVADVARQLGRRWIGIELSQAYCDDHIIPRLSEPLLEWAEKQEEQEEQQAAIQMELL